MSFFNWRGGGSSTPEPPESGSLKHKREFCALLNRKGMHYRDLDDDPTSVLLPFGGGDFCFDHLICHVDFDPNSTGKGNSIHLFIPCVRNFPSYSRERGLQICNKIIKEKRWVRPYIDSDGDLDFDGDMFIDGDTAAQETLDLVQITMSIIDDVYQEIQRA